MNQRENPIKVSVCVITYNQARYIRQCLQSILDQKTDFAFEVIVGDDCSNDGTRDIVQEFANRYPGVVKPIFHATNIGGTRNLLLVYAQAAGEFIAHIDGDDYMLPGKLGIQAAELARNPDCSMCVHAMHHFDEVTQSYLKVRPPPIPRQGDMAFLLMNLPYFAHSSKMFRATCLAGFDAGGAERLDCYFHVHHALRGKILYLDAVLGVYRVNVGIATVKDRKRSRYKSPSPALLGLVIDAIEYAGRSGVSAELVEKAKAKAYFASAYSHLMAKDYRAFQVLIRKSYETAKVNHAQCVARYCVGVPGLLFLLARLKAGLRGIARMDGEGEGWIRGGGVSRADDA